MRKYLPAILALFCLFFSEIAGAVEDKVQDIVLGMSTALSGPAEQLGVQMQAGVLAAINEVNNGGGIHGRQIRLITLDDGYEPTRTSQNVSKLIKEYDIVCMIGNVGTPTAVAALPIIRKHKVPFYGAFSGSDILRKAPIDRYVINFRASYAQETAEMVEHLIKDLGLKPEEIGFLSQRDAYGTAICHSALEQMKKYDPDIEGKISVGHYNRNTLAVEKALAGIILHEPTPKAIIMASAYAPSAEFIRLAHENGYDPLFLNVSFVGSDSLCKSLGSVQSDVIITQVVPSYEQTDLPIVKEYIQAIKKRNTEASFVSLEGYISARILFKAMRQIDGDVNRDNIVESLEQLGYFDMGLNHMLQLSPTHHQACDQIWPTMIINDKVTPFDWHDLKEILRHNNDQ